MSIEEKKKRIEELTKEIEEKELDEKIGQLERKLNATKSEYTVIGKLKKTAY